MSKSRGERGKTPAQLLQPTNAPVSNDVVPGRFSETDWNNILDEETEEDFVDDILQEILGNALDRIYFKIVERRVIPYTVNVAKNLMLETIEWQFLQKDEGETNLNENKTWLEDEEPAPGVTDSWAQGIVPVLAIELPQGITETESRRGEKEQILVEEFDRYEEKKNEVDEESNLSSHTENITTKSDLYNGEDRSDKRSSKNGIHEIIPTPPAKAVHSTRKPFKPYRGKIPSFPAITMTPIADDGLKIGEVNMTILSHDTGTANFTSDSVIKTQHGRTGGREVSYDHKGNVIHVKKLNMDKLPSHRVKTRFEIVDPLEEEFKAKLASKKQRYNLFRLGDRIIQDTDEIVSTEVSISRKPDLHLVSPLPPPLVDTIDVAAGVVIKEKGVIKRGLRQPLNQNFTKDATFLEPVTNSLLNDVNKTSEDVVAGSVYKKKPLPAITT